MSKLIDLDRSRITDSFYVETVIEIKNSFVAAESEILEKYRNNYNKKIDIKLVCDEKKTDVTGSAKRYFENCSVDGLFWQ